MRFMIIDLPMAGSEAFSVNDPVIGCRGVAGVQIPAVAVCESVSQCAI